MIKLFIIDNNDIDKYNNLDEVPLRWKTYRNTAFIYGGNKTYDSVKTVLINNEISHYDLRLEKLIEF